MGKGRPAVDPRWACPALCEANDLAIRIGNLLCEEALQATCEGAERLLAVFRALGALQHKLLAADAAFFCLKEEVNPK